MQYILSNMLPYIENHPIIMYTGLVILALIVIIWSIVEIIREIKGANASKVIADRVKESIKSNPLPGTTEIVVTDVDPKEAENVVTIVTEKSTSDVFWRTHAVKITISEIGIDPNPNLEALLENHWEPISISCDGYLLLKQSIRKETTKINPKAVIPVAPST